MVVSSDSEDASRREQPAAHDCKSSLLQTETKDPVQQLLASASTLDVGRLSDQWLNDSLINFFINVFKLTLARQLKYPVLFCNTWLFSLLQ